MATNKQNNKQSYKHRLSKIISSLLLPYHGTQWHCGRYFSRSWSYKLICYKLICSCVVVSCDVWSSCCFWLSVSMYSMFMPSVVWLWSLCVTKDFTWLSCTIRKIKTGELNDSRESVSACICMLVLWGWPMDAPGHLALQGWRSRAPR